MNYVTKGDAVLSRRTGGMTSIALCIARIWEMLRRTEAWHYGRTNV